jgi:succinyl-diaminopimelate desuccinylase
MEIDAEGVVAFTQALVRARSVHDPAAGTTEEPASRLVWERLRELGWEPWLEEVAPGRSNVLCLVEGGLPGPTLVFEGHTDVVTPGDPAGWVHDPFGGDIEDGRLYGRGSADMKAGVAAMIEATRALAAAGPFPGRILLAALVDEEGMMLGAKHFVAAGHADHADAAICCEPEEGEVCPVSKGALRVGVTFTGKMAHGAMPFQGRSPNLPLGRFLLATADLQHTLQHAHPTHPLLGDVWVTPTVLRAGEPVQMNVLPATAGVWVDVRTIPGVDHDAVVAELTRLAEEAGADTGVTAAVEVIDDRPAVDTPLGSAVVRALCEAHEAVTGDPAVIGGVPGATDGTVLTSRSGIPSVVYGPGGKWIAHQAEEFVEVGTIVEAAQVYLEAARRFLHDPRAARNGHRG